MNWKMTAKTILVQMHHKIETFEHVHKKLVLVIQDKLLQYMSKEFNFSHLKSPALLGDSMHLHAYSRASCGMSELWWIVIRGSCPVPVKIKAKQRFPIGLRLLARLAEWLRNAGATLVGIDPHNIDCTDGGERPVHSMLLGAEIPIVEHMCGLDSLPERGARFFAVPAKVKGFGTFPVRAFATVEE